MINKCKDQRVNVLNLYFDNVTMSQMEENVERFFEEARDENLFIVTANPEIADYATNHVRYQRLINQADYVVPDGTGIVMGAKMLKTPLKERVPGIELMEACIRLANRKQQRVYLLGSKEEIVQQATRQLQTRYPNVTFDFHHGYIDVNDAQIAHDIRQFNPDYIFVGMGYPRQEEWIERFVDHFERTVLMGVGGSLEVFSGSKKRAPKLFRKLNVEWVYRFLIDWKRAGRLKSIPVFLYKVMQQKYNKK
ncbi:WecB/TagA/CpsF family glycosyltransferase [Staphylococcus sp. SQ8-PEA]|uniref:N-acetylglucosaminyldiphosphoundecaprenol N-acetyl-beta-D-mannosaminyltransferase n=1 Tax=Staphylococcus marylandisciuri TaxID=2981529 RepID=A0ABT2QSE9_9STAP|nr:N-acetylglucosaminyldiphosphoundecaprenol N-acetyl-beta-D-mannosaminyltransferase TarA [Staphylococcus marylandisciuri]MCU5746910.1 WecB/TagA/CpsF family glycosyltransferase [Staphylococcus marylandisciuri]